jgi:hypothetical protein
MAVMGVPLEDVVITLKFAVAAAMVAVAAVAAAMTGTPPGVKGMAPVFVATAVVGAAVFGGGEVGVCAIVGVAQRELGLIKLCKY